MNKEKAISDVVALCREVGKFIMQEADGFSLSRVELKGKNDLVSYVDKEAEKMLVSGLKVILPEAGFITEENTIEQQHAEYTWVIDPLDGTTNFIHGLPVYAISIGLLNGPDLIGGVVFELNRDEMFYAWRNGGAWMNGKRISVSTSSRIGDSLLATGFPYYNFEKLEQYLAILNDLMKNTHGLRRLGSAAVDLAYVACGRCEGFFEYNLNPWDIAGGIVLVQEAGGFVTDFKGGSDYLFGRELVAGGKAHAELLATIQRHW